MFDDADDSAARLPYCCVYLSSRKYKTTSIFTRMVCWTGVNWPHIWLWWSWFMELMRLYMTIHADHEGGNVSAHTTHLVGSALSDPYLALCCRYERIWPLYTDWPTRKWIKWIFEMAGRTETNTPFQRPDCRVHVKKTRVKVKWCRAMVMLYYGKQIPCFTCTNGICPKKHARWWNLVKSSLEYLWSGSAHSSINGKKLKPWSNVDAHSGALLVHYGMVEYEYYTVLFAVSRIRCNGVFVMGLHIRNATWTSGNR